MIFIEVESAVATERCEQVSVLREVSHTPNRRVVRQLRQSCVALFGVVSLHVEDVHLRL